MKFTVVLMSSIQFLRFCKSLCLALPAVLVLILLIGCGDDDKGPNPVDVPEVGTYYVNAEDGNDIFEGTEAAPFKTITHALTQTEPGDTVIVAPGFYDQTLGESFPIEIPDSVIMLGNPVTQGAGSDSIIISGSGEVTATYHATVVGGDGATLTGFFILNQSTTAFRVGVYSDNDGFTVIGNTIYTYWGGMYLTGAGDITVETNRFRSSLGITYGIISASSGTVVIENNNIVLSASYGISIPSGQPLVTGNYLSGNFMYGALRITSNAAPVIRDNTFNVVSNPSLLITGTAAPDLGRADDSGLNLFTGSNTVAVWCESSGRISAIGNNWYNKTTPVCEADIIVNGEGVVVWGTEVGDSCAAPVSGEFDEDANTVALWHFNTGTGTTVYDATGTGHNGTLGQGGSNVPSWEAAGRFGYGISYDGSSEEFVLANSLANDFPSNQFSIEMWVKAPSTPDFVHLFRSDNICALEMKNLSLTFSVGNGSGSTWKSLTTTILNLTDGNWHYLACTYNGTTLITYVDGIYYGQNMDAVVSMTAPDGYYIGGFPGSLCFTGVIDEMRLSNIARSPAEISAYYDLASGTK